MKIHHIKKNSVVENLSIIFIMIYIFFNVTSTIFNYGILILGIIFSILTILKRGKFSSYANNVNIVIFIFLSFNIVSLFYTSEITEGLRFIIILGCIFIYFNALIVQNNIKYIINIMLLFSTIHVFFTLLQIVYPNVVMTINSYLLRDQIFENSKKMLSWGYYTGISGYNHMNGFYISVFISIVFTFLIISPSKERKHRNIIFLYLIMLLGIIALISTQKRGIIVANVVAVFFTTVFYLRKKKKATITFIFTSIIFIMISLLILKYNTLAQNLYLRFTYNADFTSGREYIYKQVLNNFLESPILGNGVASTYAIISTGAHNIYLQLLNDYGIVGTILMLALFCIIFIFTIKIYNKYSNIIDYRLKAAILLSIFIQVYFLSYGLVGNPLFDNFILFTYILACSIPYSIRASRNNNVSNYDRGGVLYEKSRYINLS